MGNIHGGHRGSSDGRLPALLSQLRLCGFVPDGCLSISQNEYIGLERKKKKEIKVNILLMKGKPRQLAKEQTSRRRSLQCSARFRQPSTFFLFQFLKIPRLWFSTRTIKMIDKLIGDRLWAVNRNSYFKTRQNAEMVVMVEIGDGWKQTRTRGVMERRRERKMRICVEPKSRPADIVNCHSGCRQTSETDIISPYYLPLQELSSTQPLLSSFSFHLWSHFQVIFFFLFHPCTCMNMNHLI